jgi:2-(1,2-epoxy-1,2-dihydrophenyl)acetyl-CoA isomerase
MMKYNFLTEISENPLSRALELAEEINVLPPLSVKMVKKNFHFAAEKDLSAVLEREKFAQRFLGFSQDYKEGVSAFLEKRKPQFKGQ